MYAAALVLVAAAVANALPTTRTTTTLPPHQGFGVAIEVDEKFYSLNAVVNCSAAELLLVALPIDIYPGSLAYLTGTSPKAALNFDVNGEQYGAFVANVGDSYGLSVDVTAQKGYQDFNFEVTNSTIGHKLAAAPNSFLACNRTVNGEKAMILSWGDFNTNGSAPYLCTSATLKQNCHVDSSTMINCS